MESLFLAAVVLMLALAVFDLAVGVANDAVNFLTSAFGARAATVRTIMIIASVGILVGAMVSGGMMEVARKTMFNPAMFSFRDIMFIYVVVMLTDVLLLDLFNSLRLPTSTTVSIVFELLGAALAISVLKVYDVNGPIGDIFAYINSAQALKVIVAIFVSVGIAFTGGWLVQYVLRAIVTFDYKKHMRIGGPIFGAVSVVVVLNFIIAKGLKHSPIRGSEFLTFVSAHPLEVFGALFVVAYIYFFVRTRNAEYDAFKTITLFGTFALAMAFASNDLVNFIGVPLAGLDAFVLWSGSGTPAQEFMMTEFSNEGAPANMWLLALAGVIMIVVLVKSKKARNVMGTAITLSRQTPGIERFWGGDMSRAVVRSAHRVTGALKLLVPASIRSVIEKRYTLSRPTLSTSTTEKPAAFDMVRASVNLMVAATVISLGTTYKLPLSTTYVTFMVLMGTSLADRAWNRDSAVYRVSGVLTVIGGWFATALTALVTTIVFASIVHYYEFLGIGIVVGIVVIGIVSINRLLSNEEEDDTADSLPKDWTTRDVEDVKAELHSHVVDINKAYVKDVKQLIGFIVEEEGKAIKKLDVRIKKRLNLNVANRAAVSYKMRDAGIQQLETGKGLFEFLVREFDLLLEIEDAVSAAKLHVLNMHTPVDASLIQYLRDYAMRIEEYGEMLERVDSYDLPALEVRLEAIRKHVEDAMYHHIEGLASDRYSFKNSQLFLGAFIRHANASSIIHRLWVTTLPENHHQNA